ncbi:uncharacterized protein C8Q71DRAFT_488847 [Rhodofomes roseus]|uniref:Uncharacterized protein n=1 Tax=Rhodofomes roseus TaxID=34475 RepID=A0ABQ8KL00_9APHY|nr:uncharacterized protein C8Q71DRAFT_488847 [Rhodofomes roseus]KAH9838983.1 hypothetical protein C8Q71DRAFT_488847 [Rhodofomes roseus]
MYAKMTPPSSRVAAQFNEIVGIITNVERNHCTLAHFATPEQKRGRAAFLYKQAASVFDKLKRDMSSEEKARWRALQNRVDLLKDDNAVDYANASDELWRFTVRMSRSAFEHHSLYLNPPRSKAKTDARSPLGKGNMSATKVPQAATYPARTMAPRVPPLMAMPVPPPLWYYSPRRPRHMPLAYPPPWVPTWVPSASPIWYPIPIAQYY